MKRRSLSAMPSSYATRKVLAEYRAMKARRARRRQTWINRRDAAEALVDRAAMRGRLVDRIWLALMEGSHETDHLSQLQVARVVVRAADALAAEVLAIRKKVDARARRGGRS